MEKYTTSEGLIGEVVMEKRTKRRGVITDIDGKILTVCFYGGETAKYRFPAVFADQLILKNTEKRAQYEKISSDDGFDLFKQMYVSAVRNEINYLHQTGGKRYKAIDGVRMGNRPGVYIYSFETDVELHFPDATQIKIQIPGSSINASVISCEEFTIIIQTVESLGQHLTSIEFTAEPWHLMEALTERLSEMDPKRNPLAYQVACRGKYQLDPRGKVLMGQNIAQRKVMEQPVTFIWGPPGTGKTTTLANIALQFLGNGKRVLMLSYSNVSVDGALLRVAKKADNTYLPGSIIRYGYPRLEELLDDPEHTSYLFVLSHYPELVEKSKKLKTEKAHLKKDDPRRAEIQKDLSKIRMKLREEEQELIQEAPFVATTVSKALVDKAVYSQHFDLVIFDEASMAYVPQVVFAAGLASSRFCCLGDFRQLPVIVQSSENRLLEEDIFNYTGITTAVETEQGHSWLVMLNYQFRMHPDIARFASRSVYGGLLESDPSVFESRQIIAQLDPLKDEPLGLIDLSGTYSVCIKTMDGSRINILSAFMCMKLAEMLCNKYNVGIITPYNAQSRLILAMIRDLRERDKTYESVGSATVHQFQGSERPIIIYDTVDCFRMPYPGTLLTSMKNDIADRLFNVAVTRAQGKFIMVANTEYLIRKKISRDLMISKLLSHIRELDASVAGETIIDQIGTLITESPDVFLGDRDEVDSWNRFLEDLENASSEIHMEIPGMIDDDPDALTELMKCLKEKKREDIRINIRKDENVVLPNEFIQVGYSDAYVTMPVTIIDRNIIWYGEPLSAADFISEGTILQTRIFPCFRFEGKHTARMLKTVLEI